MTDSALGEAEGGKDVPEVVKVSLDQPMDAIRQQLSQYPIRTRLSLTGTIVVARDIAHAKLQERIDAGEGLPQYMKDHAVYYAGPAKTPEGYASGSFGPTTAGRMDAYVDAFQKAGGSMVMLAKGNRSKMVTRACQKYGGFYLGSIGGPAAILARTRSRASRCSSILSSAWRLSGKFASRTSQRLSLWTTKVTTSSRSGRRNVFNEVVPEKCAWRELAMKI